MTCARCRSAQPFREGPQGPLFFGEVFACQGVQFEVTLGFSILCCVLVLVNEFDGLGMLGVLFGFGVGGFLRDTIAEVFCGAA